MGQGGDYQRWCWDSGQAAHTLAVMGVLVLALVGRPVESLGGWIAYPPRIVVVMDRQAKRRARAPRYHKPNWGAGWAWMRHSWPVVLVRSGTLLVLAPARRGWGWVCLLPWLVWVWRGLGIAWPSVGTHPLYGIVRELGEAGSRWALIGLGTLWLLKTGRDGCAGMAALGMVETEHRSVTVQEDESGVYHVRLRGEFELQVDGQDLTYKRLLIIFLGLLNTADAGRGSRRTRDGRRPFVRQMQLAEWFGVRQPHVSLWNRWWLEKNWRRLLSVGYGEVLTDEVRQQVVERWAKFPWWSSQRMHQHLKQGELQISLRQVKQIGRESGWTTLRQRLKQTYQIGVDTFQPQDQWLTGQLLAQVASLVGQLEALNGLTTEQKTELADLEALCSELDVPQAAALEPPAWHLQLEQRLFGQWSLSDDAIIRCTYCGTTDVAPKSCQGRLKTYTDAQGNPQTIEVQRYYCHNPACAYQSFTHLPSHLIPHSPRSLTGHLAVLQAYVWSRGVYRRTSQMLGVSKTTAYRWVSAFGHQLLPVAALFGVVRSSGVVGVDEKYVLVPKNDKPDAKMKRWMYVYVAVDCYSYDLLHIDIYPYNTTHSARAFLLALRAKGYHPRAIVTDMRTDYSAAISAIFPKTLHHECIFHALQAVHKRFKEIYGSDYADRRPDLVALRKEIDAIFTARTKRTAHRRYDALRAQRQHVVASTPEASGIFDFLERHWPYLINAIESRHVPLTNNATEQVIRLFSQHYKTFCGFETIESARCYLAVFEKVYRFTPFSADAQARIRGKCPLELAGYEVHKLPMAQLLRGLALQWPPAAFEELVPNA